MVDSYEMEADVRDERVDRLDVNLGRQGESSYQTTDAGLETPTVGDLTDVAL